MKNGFYSATTFPGSTALPFVISTGAVVGHRPTQGDEKWVLFGNHTQWKHRPPVCHLDRSAAEWRDLCLNAFSWKCFSYRRSRLTNLGIEHASLDRIPMLHLDKNTI